MNEKKKAIEKAGVNGLFDRVVSILEIAHSNVVRSVNSNMVTAYWLIGREIVETIQSGEQRADYGKQVLGQLSQNLTKRYNKGFSVPNLQNFRKFYLAFPDRIIQYPSGTKSSEPYHVLTISHLSGGEFDASLKGFPTGSESVIQAIPYPAGSELSSGFNPNLGWSHYRALMRVDNEEARNFYEKEAAECGWSKAQLERQIHSSYYERIIGNRGKTALASTSRERLPGESFPPERVLKSPYVLEFLNLPDTPALHESDLEQAIINNLQAFLLELGKGFSFVARQKHIRFDEDDFYIDLVFYNFILKCFLLIDLKIGKLTHQDVGQMDGYVRFFEDRFKVAGDNPTIGLILCSDKGEAVARYSVLNEGRQIFASKYLNYLPSEEELQNEIEKDRNLVEAAAEENETSELAEREIPE
ncbi:MAG: hypothetical protein A2W80_17805 [Candidatus Riflebacteria bacterium GWC2_50_8]|nr:MAG: hypothetical protein A2W80_17805 [Candidatus Riflebacteria bacterium GWC2_50_8]